jgi:hypothetical protein
MKLLNKNGFSMVQIMMAAGMMGILSLGMMKMMETQTKSAKSIKSSVEVQAFYNEARAYLGKSSYCTANFKGEVMNEGDQFDLEELIKPNGKVLYKVGKIYGDRSFRISKIEVIDFEKDSEISGIMKLQFVLDKIGKSYGAKSYTKILKIDVALNDKRELTSCATMGSLLTGISGSEGSEQVDNIEGTIKDMQEGKNTEDTEKVQDTINKNSRLQQFQKSVDTVDQVNKRMEQMLNE